MMQSWPPQATGLAARMRPIEASWVKGGQTSTSAASGAGSPSRTASASASESAVRPFIFQFPAII